MRCSDAQMGIKEFIYLDLCRSYLAPYMWERSESDRSRPTTEEFSPAVVEKFFKEIRGEEQEILDILKIFSHPDNRYIAISEAQDILYLESLKKFNTIQKILDLIREPGAIDAEILCAFSKSLSEILKDLKKMQTELGLFSPVSQEQLEPIEEEEPSIALSKKKKKKKKNKKKVRPEAPAGAAAAAENLSEDSSGEAEEKRELSPEGAQREDRERVHVAVVEEESLLSENMESVQQESYSPAYWAQKKAEEQEHVRIEEEVRARKFQEEKDRELRVQISELMARRQLNFYKEVIPNIINPLLKRTMQDELALAIEQNGHQISLRIPVWEGGGKSILRFFHAPHQREKSDGPQRFWRNTLIIDSWDLCFSCTNASKTRM